MTINPKSREYKTPMRSIIFETERSTKNLFKTYCVSNGLTMTKELNNMLKEYLVARGLLDEEALEEDENVKEL